MSVISPSAQRFARENIEKQRRFDLEREAASKMERWTTSEVKVKDISEVVEALNKRNWSDEHGWNRPMNEIELREAYTRARQQMASKWRQFSESEARFSDQPTGDRIQFAKVGPTQVWKLPPWKTSP